MNSYNLDDLRSELEDYAAPQKKTSRTPQEERIIAGFEEIERFVEENGRLPQHGEDRDIFERLYAVRLDRIRESAECQSILKDIDKKGLLKVSASSSEYSAHDLDDDELLSELGISTDAKQEISHLTHVKTRAERRAAEEIAQRTVCKDFEFFKPLFLKVQNELNVGTRTTLKFEKNTEIALHSFFILFGQKAYVAEMGPLFENAEGRKDSRLRVVFDNGTQSNMLMRSMQRALYKDELSRRIVSANPNFGPLFSDENEESHDIQSGLIYVGRSKSNHPEIKKYHTVLHKIGVTRDSIEKRISDAKNDPTFLMAEVEIVATYKLSNISRVKLENLIHKFFTQARLDIEIKDRFGKPIIPREWYLVPLFVIDEAVELIKSGAITQFSYDAELGKIVPIK